MTLRLNALMKRGLNEFTQLEACCMIIKRVSISNKERYAPSPIARR